MKKDWPIVFAAAAADGIAVAHYVSSRFYRCKRTGPLHLQLLQPMASLGPISFPAGAADAQGWAHCIFRSCSR
jgi:hypothetical protein